MAGRPAFQPTRQQRDLVATAAGGGATQQAIALALGLTVPTLRKCFADELQHGAARRRFEVLLSLFAAARRGQAGAARRYLANEPEEFVQSR